MEEMKQTGGTCEETSGWWSSADKIDFCRLKTEKRRNDLWSRYEKSRVCSGGRIKDKKESVLL